MPEYDDITLPTDERSLADEAPLAETQDETPEVTPESVDLGELAAGWRPTRRSVRIYPQGHLIAQMDDLIDRIESAPAEADVDDLIDEYEAVKAKYHQGVKFVFEQRSDEWVDDLRKKAHKRHKVKDDSPTQAQSRKIAADMIAGQCVEPQGVTPQMVMAIWDQNETDVDILAFTMKQANQGSLEASKVASRDFSLRRSTRDGTRRSSKR